MRYSRFIPIFFIIFVFGFFSLSSVQAANSKDTEYIDTKAGNKFIAGETLDIEEDIDGDLFALGTEISIEAEITDNAIVAGERILIDGDVYGDLFLAGGYVVINGDIYGDLRIAAGKVIINSQIIGGDINLASQELLISENTEIIGEKFISAEESDESAKAENLPVNLDDADDYSFDYNFDGSDFAKVMTVSFTVFSIAYSVISFIASLLLGFVVVKLFPTFTEKTVDRIKKSPLQSAASGIAVLISGFIITFVLIFSIIGFKLWLFLVLLAILGSLLADIYVRYVLGRVILLKTGNEKTGRFIPLFLGSVIIDGVMFVLNFIPVVGWLINSLIKLLIISLGVGAMVLNKMKALK